MIKKFDDFVNESYTSSQIIETGVYGENLFESISDTLMEKIYDSINENRVSLDENMLNEGFFTNLFKGASKRSEEKVDDVEAKKEYFKKLIQETTSGGDIIKLGLSVKKEEMTETAWKLINTLCNDAVELCDKLNQKEEETKNAITRKLSLTKQAIDDFVKKSTETFQKIVETSKNAVVDVLLSLRMLLGKLAQSSKDALETIGKGAIIGVCLPFVLVYSTYKSVVKLCEKLCEKAQKVWGEVKESLTKYSKVVSDWFKTQLSNIKDKLIDFSKKMKDGEETVVREISKAYLYVVGVCGLVIDKTKSEIRDTYLKFVESAKNYSTQVKDYILDRWDKVTTWSKEKSGEFVEGVKSVWTALKDKVNQVMEAGKDAAERLKEFANSKVDELEDWSDSKQKSFCKSILAYAVKNFGEDEVKSWI